MNGRGHRVGVCAGGSSSALRLTGCLTGGNWKVWTMDSGEKSMVKHDAMSPLLTAWLPGGEGDRPPLSFHVVGTSSLSFSYRYRTTTRGFLVQSHWVRPDIVDYFGHLAEMRF